MVTTSIVRRAFAAVAAIALLLFGMAGFVATAAGAAANDVATPTAELAVITLHNNTAGPATDCPAGGAAYWHFVLAPNSGVSAFVTITLNLDGTIVDFTGAQIVLNGTQHDNVFVAVPAGYTLTSLRIDGSSATYTGETPEQFNLSTVCNGTIPTTTTTTTAAPTTTVTPTSVAPTSVVAPTTAAAEVLGITETAVTPEGELPYTGTSLTLHLGLAAAAMMAGGALLVRVAQRRTA